MTNYYGTVPLKSVVVGVQKPNAVLNLVAQSKDAPTYPVAVVAQAPSATEALIERLPVQIYDERFIEKSKELPYNLHNKISLIQTPSGKVYAVILVHNKLLALAIRSKKLNAFLSDLARRDGNHLQKADLAELNDGLEAYAEQFGKVTDVWLRVAPIEGGIEIDHCDELHTRTRITAGKVEMVSSSDTVFYRTVNTQAMIMPAEKGDLNLLKKYLNVHATSVVQLVAWITYTLAHPKAPSSKYPILVLSGNEGSGKSSLCKNVLIRLIDPNAIGVQVFPQNAKDLAIASQTAHLLCFDNIRGFKHNMADMLCIAATGGTITTRQLYTNDEQQSISLHAAIVLNGIHSFIDTPDLSQRCLPIHLISMEKAKRKSEEQLTKELEADLPAIMRGLFDLIAEVFTHLPNVEITHPERMIEFSRWLGAMELAAGVPAGIYQELYSDTLQQGQLDTLMDNPLAAALIEFADKYVDDFWSGTPAALLNKLSDNVSFGTQRSREWPQNPIALSKRIAGLQAGLLSQGIKIELTRGKERTVTITKIGV
jgi:hypothetical protein